MGVPILQDPNENAVSNSSGNVVAATATATMPAVPTRTNYCTGFEFTFGGATGAALVVATLTGMTGGPLSYIITVPAGVTLGGQLIVTFTVPLAASGPNVAIVFSCPSLGAGNTNAVANIHGYLL